ncbi:hypothetical protein M0R45_011530 [Rubus argutus]|uniref:NTF2 domain-containing protein n=1 Tax=Rubus argutus TaxID=59490 RepID=A0AAW1YEB9_RUBAR
MGNKHGPKWRRNERSNHRYMKPSFSFSLFAVVRRRRSGAAEMDPDAVAKALAEHYYSLLDSNRAAPANLYQEGSMLTFEGQKIQGS